MLVSDEARRVRDAYARRPLDDRYDARRPDQIAIAAARARVWGSALRAEGHDLGRVLEVGSGAGAVLRWALEAGAASVTGVDVVPGRLEAARDANTVTLAVLADGQALPIASDACDTVICSTLFSSVLDDRVARGIAAELDRVLAPGGLVLWFDFFRDNPRNPDVRGVRAADLARWFPGYRADLERVVLAPPIARRLDRHPHLAAFLATLPPLRTHHAGTLRRT